MEAWQEEDERVGIGRGDEQADDGKGEESGGVARELVFRFDRPTRNKPVSRDKPGGGAQQAEHQQCTYRPADVVERCWASPGGAEEAHGAKEEEHRAAQEPERKAAP